LEQTLTRYIRALRGAGAAVSPAEAIDAARAVALVGYGERATLKDSLGLILAKTEEEKAIHDRLFELYFASRAASQAATAEDEPAEGARARDQDGEGERGEGAADRVDDLIELARGGDPDRLAAEMERAAAEVGADGIRFSSQASFFTRRLLEAMGIEALEARLMQRLDARTEASRADAAALMDARSTLARRAREVVDTRYAVFGEAATEAFMNDAVANRPIDRLGLRDMERMKALVARMARRLAIRHARRRKQRDRAHLDIRHTLRANAGHDFVPFELVFRRKVRDKPKIVAICDVSGSVASYVRFLLLFLYALNDKVADLGAFAFSSHLRPVGDSLRRLDFEAALAQILYELGAGSTDYGQALADLREHGWEQIDRRTTVLVLGDGRSNRTDPRLELFAELADRAKRVVWLCPEPPARWGSGDSALLQYRPYCTLLTHCATALDLENALDEILMAYD
jgi:uncharacterized protein